MDSKNLAKDAMNAIKSGDKPVIGQDATMISSIISVGSSVASPVTDSGVQLLDSEGDVTSVMSVSGMACDIDSNETEQESTSDSLAVENVQTSKDDNVMTTSDIENHNSNSSRFSSSAPNLSSTIPLKGILISTGSKSLPDDINKASDNDNRSVDSFVFVSPVRKPKDIDPMHISMSEEVSETLKSDPNTAESSQRIESGNVVMRRQKKSKKSDTPKKRVSFHEDILNSTKIDDIRINHGFVTYEPNISLSFSLSDYIKKCDVVAGRYSWAAEGDCPFVRRKEPDRQVKSDMYILRQSSTSSSSTSDQSSSFDENEENQLPSRPKKSCLKKTKHKDPLENAVLGEGIKKSDSGLIDTAFGSLKNIFITASAPTVETGLIENPEERAIDSTTTVETESDESPKDMSSLNTPKKKGSLNLTISRSSLKLDKYEGFFPNYPSPQNLNNVVICDSHVYEHRGVSSSYRYEEFKKTFEEETKPKSKSIFTSFFKELNIFKKFRPVLQSSNSEETAVIPTETVEKIEPEDLKSPNESESKIEISKVSSRTSDITSETDTYSDFTDTANTKHLSSPKRRIKKPNHYAVQNPITERSESPLPEENLQGLRSNTSKASLINRFLKNVTVRKYLDSKMKQKKDANGKRKRNKLYIKGVTPDWELSRSKDIEIEKELRKKKRVKETPESRLGNHVIEKLKKCVFRNSDETLLSVFYVNKAYTDTGESTPLVLFLTNSTIYISSVKLNCNYVNRYVLPFTELDFILLGPSQHLIVFSNRDKDMQFSICTGNTDLSAKIVSKLEFAMRRDSNQPKLPAVRQLTIQELRQLRHKICRQTAVERDEKYFYYSIVRVQDIHSERPESQFGPCKEGPLMFKNSLRNWRWETGYFVLKGGALHMFSSHNHRIPLRIIPLIDGGCLSAKRTPRSQRPHTFEIVTKVATLHLAAPDDLDASEWLQAIVQTASGMPSNSTNSSPAKFCTFLMTSEHLIAVRETFGVRGPIQVLSCAAITDITAIKLPASTQSWCLIEFSCREVHDNTGDWIVYFANNTELEIFISSLEMLWTDYSVEDIPFPMSTLPVADHLSKKGSETYITLTSQWDSFGLHA